MDHGQSRKLCAVAQAREFLQDSLRGNRQAFQLAYHEVDDVVSVALGVNAIQIPGPARGVGIEGEQSLLGQRRQKLNDEERIAACLLVHECRELVRTCAIAMERIRNQLPRAIAGERCKLDLLNQSSAFRDASRVRSSGCEDVTSLLR